MKVAKYFLYDELRKLTDALNTLVVSTADCERAFSSMNIILTACRYSLSVDTLASLMFIAICGPPIELFKPDSYVSSWLQNHVSADGTKARARSADDSQSERGLQNLWRLMYCALTNVCEFNFSLQLLFFCYACQKWMTLGHTSVINCSLCYENLMLLANCKKI